MNIKLLWWRIRYAYHAMRIMHVSPKFAWQMATATDDFYDNEESPYDALVEDLSYWYD